jgi:hypothetical protein
MIVSLKMRPRTIIEINNKLIGHDYISIEFSDMNWNCTKELICKPKKGMIYISINLIHFYAK